MKFFEQKKSRKKKKNIQPQRATSKSLRLLRGRERLDFLLHRDMDKAHSDGDAPADPGAAPAPPIDIDTAIDTAAAAAAADSEDAAVVKGLAALEAKNVHWYSYLTTADFWLVLAIGQVLCLCNTATNTFTTFLNNYAISIPAFQTLFNYVLLALIYVPVMFCRHGPRQVARVVRRDGWKYLLLGLLDVEGNYFTVLAYRYTNLLSAQLLNFWSIVCVVALSFALLRVRYQPAQLAGILAACAGMGLLLASDHLTGSDDGGGGPTDPVRGDLFGLLGATFYGLSNVFEEWFVSRRPVYEVLAFLGLVGACVNGVQCAVLERAAVARAADWPPAAAGYVAGYSLALTLFYSLAPLLLRMASAAFFDISLLTGNFWGVVVGVHVFGYAVHYLYPVAFVLIVLGLVAYFLAGSMLGDAKKPWLGDAQAGGVTGLGTARLKALNEARKQQQQQQQGSV